MSLLQGTLNLTNRAEINASQDNLVHWEMGMLDESSKPTKPSGKLIIISLPLGWPQSLHLKEVCYMVQGILIH